MKLFVQAARGVEREHCDRISVVVESAMVVPVERMQPD
jgi:hypothetical protein